MLMEHFIGPHSEMVIETLISLEVENWTFREQLTTTWTARKLYLIPSPSDSLVILGTGDKDVDNSPIHFSLFQVYDRSPLLS